MPPDRTAAGIVFAMPVEADAFAARAREPRETQAAGLVFHEGLIAGRRVAWVVGGAGADRAARACRLIVEGHRPRLIISAGFAGALATGFVRGTVVMPGRAFRAGDAVLDLVAGGEPRNEPLPTIVTVDRVACSADDKRALADATGADLVDMETWGVARAARDAGLGCACLRVVSDTATDDLPLEVASLVKPQSGLRRLGAALRALSQRPGAAVDMWRLWENAVVHGRLLADALERHIARIPVEP